ncbi:MAG: hypothetical protein AB1585_12370 [Thermodesulfobacteriota bacterium]
MGRYLIMWEADESKIPVNPEERKVGWLGAIEMTKQDIKSGMTKDWGNFFGQPKGFSIGEGTEEELNRALIRYIPYFRFKVYPFLSIEKTEENIKTL